MSQTTVTVDVPATTKKVKTWACDKCGRPSGRTEESGAGIEIDDGTLHVHARIEATDTERSKYVEAGCTKVMSVDCCYECFIRFVIPALEAIGFEIRTSDVEW